MYRSGNLIPLCFIFLFMACGSSVKKEAAVIEEHTEISNGIATSSFKVWGNCGMCQKTIESSLKVKGIEEARWDSDTKLITVKYNAGLITLDQIHKNIASVGYDTEKYKADSSVYAKLHECCQYERN